MVGNRKKTSARTNGTRTRRSGGSSYGDLLTTALDASGEVADRVNAIALLVDTTCEKPAVFEALLELLRDREAPPKVRYAALATLQAASFSVVAFAELRPRYRAALRSLAKDPELELRQRVLGLLSREKDGKAQKLLLEGLKDPEKALLPPEKALQLLSYDVHGEAYDVARALVKNPPNMEAKREALRLLAADARSTPIFEKVLRDKAEPADIRQLSASALHTLAPKKLQEHARELVLDGDEDEDVQAAGLTAIRYFGNPMEVAADDMLRAGVARLEKRSRSEALKDDASRFLAKYAGRK